MTTIFLLSLAATLLFALFDYWGYNEALRSKTPMWAYRALQAIAQLITCWLLRLIAGSWGPAALFTLFWWTWLADLFYYLLAELLRWYPSEVGCIRNTLLAGKVEWAWWTPLGLARWALSGERTRPIPGHALLLQALLPPVASLLILLLS